MIVILFLSPNHRPVNVDGYKDAAVIVYSYRKQLPKSIRLSHALLLDKITRASSVTSDDILFAFSSLYWLSGIGAMLKGTIYGATRLITSQSFSPETLFRLIENYKITVLLIPTHQMQLALKHKSIQSTDFSSVKILATGGQKTAFNQYLEMKKYLINGSVNIMYGMSELGGAVSINVLNDIQSAKDTVGKLVSDTTVKITDDDGNRLGIGLKGRLCVKSSFMLTGYSDEPASHDSTTNTIDSEGFFKSDDYGYFDDNGNLYVIDRQAEIIRCNDSQISPIEIENHLIQNAYIKAVCVIGIPDATAHSLLSAVVIRNDNSTISENEISNLVSGIMCYYLLINMTMTLLDYEHFNGKKC